MMTWDAFISHASEDKDRLVRPLAGALRELGVSVWYDEFTLEPGVSLSRSIDRGLATSRYGVVVLSPHFFAKRWPEYELRGLVAREIAQDRVIVPVWYGIDYADVLSFSPPLADKFAVIASDKAISETAMRLLKVLRPDLYSRHPRTLQEARVERLIHQLGAAEAADRLFAVKELCEMPAIPIAAVPELIRAFRDEFSETSVEVPSFALRALETIGAPAATDAVPVLVSSLSAALDDPLADRIITALGAFGEFAVEAVPVLCDILARTHQDQERLGRSDPYGEFLAGVACKAALQTLRKIGPGARTAIPVLTSLAEGDDDLEVRALAAAAIGSISPDFVATLVETLTSAQDVRRQEVAAIALGHLRVSDPTVIRALLNSITIGASRSVTLKSIGSLRSIGYSAMPRDSVPVLLGMLTGNSDETVKIFATHCFVALRVDADDVVAALVEWCLDNRIEDRVLPYLPSYCLAALRILDINGAMTRFIAVMSSRVDARRRRAAISAAGRLCQDIDHLVDGVVPEKAREAEVADRGATALAEQIHSAEPEIGEQAVVSMGVIGRRFDRARQVVVDIASNPNHPLNAVAQRFIRVHYEDC